MSCPARPLAFLSDGGRIVQKDPDLAEYTDPVNNPMIPHVIVLEPGLVIYKIYNGCSLLAARRLRISVKSSVPSPRNAGQIGIFATPAKAARKEGRKELFINRLQPCHPPRALHS